MMMGLTANLPPGFPNLRMDLHQDYPSFMNMVESIYERIRFVKK